MFSSHFLALKKLHLRLVLCRVISRDGDFFMEEFAPIICCFCLDWSGAQDVYGVCTLQPCRRLECSCVHILHVSNSLKIICLRLFSSFNPTGVPALLHFKRSSTSTRQIGVCLTHSWARWAFLHKHLANKSSLHLVFLQDNIFPFGGSPRLVVLHLIMQLSQSKLKKKK